MYTDMTDDGMDYNFSAGRYHYTGKHTHCVLNCLYK